MQIFAAILSTAGREKLIVENILKDLIIQLLIVNLNSHEVSSVMCLAVDLKLVWDEHNIFVA